MELKALFEKAIAESKTLASKPSNDTMLQLYALYKQSTVGDVNTDPPSNPFDFVSKAKYDAWATMKGNTTDKSMNDYIDLVNKLKG